MTTSSTTALPVPSRRPIGRRVWRVIARSAVCVLFGVTMTYAVAWLPLVSETCATWTGHGETDDPIFVDNNPRERARRHRRTGCTVYQIWVDLVNEQTVPDSTSVASLLSTSHLSAHFDTPSDFARKLRGLPDEAQFLVLGKTYSPMMESPLDLIDAGFPYLGLTAWRINPFYIATEAPKAEGGILIRSMATREPTYFDDAPMVLPYRPIWPGFAFNTVFYAVLVGGLYAVGVRVLRSIRERFRSRRGICPKCTYDLRGLSAGAVCPECGHATRVARSPSA